jgi:hypothetical protein
MAISKRKLHHRWRYIRHIKAWQVLGLAIIMSVVALQAYRQNSQNIIPLVDAVVAADKAGSGVDEALRELGNYMTNHMNADIASPIRLENTFYRAYNEAVQSGQPSANGEIYKKAQSICEDPSILLAQRALCIQEYVLEHAQPGQDYSDPNLPRAGDYTYDFVVPAWSPDAAGFSILVAALLWVALGARLIAGALVTRALRQYQ